jgi:cell division protein FtsB
MPTGAAIVLVVICFISVFVAYWVGKDSGEKAGFASQQEALERVTRSNVALKIEVQRLRRERDVYAERAQRSGYGGYPPIP